MYSRFIIIPGVISLLLLKSINSVYSTDAPEQTDSDTLTRQHHSEPLVFDQGDIASSTACAITAMMQVPKTTDSSGLLDYYRTRDLTSGN